MTYIHQRLFDDLRLFTPDLTIAGAALEADIVSAEHALGVTFPPAYRAFVAAVGACDDDGDDIFGVSVPPSRVLGVSVVTHTMRARTEGLAHRYLVLRIGSYGNTYLDLEETERPGHDDGHTFVPASGFDTWLRTKLQRDIEQAEMNFDTAIGESFCEQLDADTYDFVPHDYFSALHDVLPGRLTPQLIDTTLRENVAGLTAALNAYFECSPLIPVEAVEAALDAVLWRWPAVPSDQDPRRPT